MQTNRSIRVTILAAFVFIALSFAARAADDFARDFADANRLYDQAKYTEAEKLFDSIAGSGHYSPELFYNLGNTEFRLDKPGTAILNYERASWLSPGNPEITANLAYARGQTGARIGEKSWRDELIRNFGINSYCWIAAVAAWIGVFAATALLLKARAYRTSLALAAIFGAAVLGYAVFAIRHLQKDDALAIVTAKTAEARYAPADNSTLAATLPVGSRVWILEQRGPWTHCRLPDNIEAWIPAGSIERVRPQNS